MRSALVVALILSSCAAPPTAPAKSPNRPVDWSAMAETPEQAALRLWSYEHGVASHICVDHVHNAKIQILSEEDLEDKCQRKAAGCMVKYDPEDGAVILLNDNLEGKSYEILVHELLHVLVVCAGISEGNNHSDPVWRHVPMSNLPPESPWYVPRPAPVAIQAGK